MNVPDASTLRRQLSRALARPLTATGAASSAHLLMLLGAALVGRDRPPPGALRRHAPRRRDPGAR